MQTLIGVCWGIILTSPCRRFGGGGKIDPENPKIISVYDALKPKLGEILL